MLVLLDISRQVTSQLCCTLWHCIMHVLSSLFLFCSSLLRVCLSIRSLLLLKPTPSSFFFYFLVFISPFPMTFESFSRCHVGHRDSLPSSHPLRSCFLPTCHPTQHSPLSTLSASLSAFQAPPPSPLTTP